MLLGYAWKGLIRRRTRSALNVLGVAISVALLVAVLAITESVRGAVQDSLGAAGADMIVQKRVKPCPFAPVKIPKDLAAIPSEVVEKLASQPGVEQASGVLELWAFHEGHPTVVTGMDPDIRQLGPVRLAERHEDEKCCAIVNGRYLVGPDDYHTIITTDYAEAIGAQVGDKIPLGPVHEFEVVGTVDLGETARVASAEAFIPLKIAQQMLGQGEVVDTIFLALKHTRYAQAVTDMATQLIGPNVSITTATQVDAGTAALARVNQLALVGVAVIALAFVLLLVLLGAVSSVTSRTNEVGLMKALGWRGWIVAYVYGSIARLQLPDALSSYPPCSTTSPPLSLPLTIQPSPLIFGLAILLALTIGGLAGLAAARRAASLDPAAALRRL